MYLLNVFSDSTIRNIMSNKSSSSLRTIPSSWVWGLVKQIDLFSCLPFPLVTHNFRYIQIQTAWYHYGWAFLLLLPHGVIFYWHESGVFFYQEGFGRYLDLHELFNEFINSKFGEKFMKTHFNYKPGEKHIEYSAYLDVFPQTHKISRNLKMTR